MLVLSRKIAESVVVGGADGLTRLLKVTVLEIRSGVVKLGFEANDDVPVHRSEVWDRLTAQQWGADEPSREIPLNAMAEMLLRTLRQPDNSPATADRRITRRTHSSKRSV